MHIKLFLTDRTQRSCQKRVNKKKHKVHWVKNHLWQTGLKEEVNYKDIKLTVLHIIDKKLLLIDRTQRSCQKRVNKKNWDTLRKKAFVTNRILGRCEF